MQTETAIEPLLAKVCMDTFIWWVLYVDHRGLVKAHAFDIKGVVRTPPLPNAMIIGMEWPAARWNLSPLPNVANKDESWWELAVASLAHVWLPTLRHWYQLINPHQLLGAWFKYRCELMLINSHQHISFSTKVEKIPCRTVLAWQLSSTLNFSPRLTRTKAIIEHALTIVLHV
jgi:hypothetical protein